MTNLKINKICDGYVEDTKNWWIACTILFFHMKHDQIALALFGSLKHKK